jgi:hypothetical protein
MGAGHLIRAVLIAAATAVGAWLLGWLSALVIQYVGRRRYVRLLSQVSRSCRRPWRAVPLVVTELGRAAPYRDRRHGTTGHPARARDRSDRLLRLADGQGTVRLSRMRRYIGYPSTSPVAAASSRRVELTAPPAEGEEC